MSRYRLGYVAPLKEVPECGSVSVSWDRSRELKYSADFVRRHLFYDLETGVFTRRTGRNTGKIAGCLGRQGYWSIKLGKDGFPAHRLAWVYVTGEWPDTEIDHIDLNRSNNQWLNLRSATRGQNQSNGHLYKNNLLGYKGVSSIPNRPGKFRARIRKNGKEISLGVWGSVEQAHEAYIAAAQKLHGEFWRV